MDRNSQPNDRFVVGSGHGRVKAGRLFIAMTFPRGSEEGETPHGTSDSHEQKSPFA